MAYYCLSNKEKNANHCGGVLKPLKKLIGQVPLQPNLAQNTVRGRALYQL